MNQNNKLIIILLIFVLLLVVGVFAFIMIKNNTQDNNSSSSSITTEVTVEKLEDGTKLNTSSKLSQIKRVGNLEISNSQITNKDGKTTLLADVKNIGTETINSLELQIILLDESGKEIKTLNGILGTIKTNETTQLNVASTQDYTNIYDYTIKIK